MTKSAVDRISRHRHLLSVFDKLNSKQRRSVQKNLNLDQIKFIIEIFYNILTGRIDVSTEVKDQLEKYKRSIRLITNRKVPLKKKVLKLQSGKFLLPILQVIATSVIPILLEKLIGSDGK
jgi:hypothetical protein